MKQWQFDLVVGAVLLTIYFGGIFLNVDFSVFGKLEKEFSMLYFLLFLMGFYGLLNAVYYYKRKPKMEFQP